MVGSVAWFYDICQYMVGDVDEGFAGEVGALLRQLVDVSDKGLVIGIVGRAEGGQAIAGAVRQAEVGGVDAGFADLAGEEGPGLRMAVAQEAVDDAPLGDAGVGLLVAAATGGGDLSFAQHRRLRCI